METQEIDNVIQRMEDVKLVIKIRDMDHKTRWEILNKLQILDLERISSQYWCFDMIDLFAMENSLMARFLELADISELYKTK